MRAALAPVVQMRLPALIARINAAFGHRAVARIRIVQDGPAAAAFAEAPRHFDPAPAAPPPEGGPAEGIADAGLRDALATLGRNIITRALKEGSRR